MTTPHKDNWEDAFDERFAEMGNMVNPKRQIKDFIRSLFPSYQQRVIEAVESSKVISYDVKPDVRDIFEMWHDEFKAAVIEAIKKIEI